MFEAAYASSWHNPILFWIVGLGFLAVLIRARGPAVAGDRAWLWNWAAVFTVSIMVDAWCSGGFSPTANTALATPIGISFVILGDFRFFLVRERFAPGAGPAGIWLRAIAWAFLIPVASTVARKVYPGPFEDSRITFLTYEAAFVVLALVFRFAVVPRQYASAPAAVREWIAGVTTFEIVQYGLWVLADVVILAGHDAGFALRFVPNILYYAAFVPFVWLTAPHSELSGLPSGGR